MIEQRILDRCIERFSKEPSVLSVWLLGSALTDRLRVDSDVDFAVRYEPGTKRDLGVQCALTADLETILGRPVDLGRLSSRNLVYAAQATQKGQLIFARDGQDTIAYASRLLSMYLDFKYVRKVVEDAYCA